MPELPPLENTTNDAKFSEGEMPVPILDEAGVGPSSKDVMIGAGALICLALVFFFIRNAFVNYLVSSLKRSPNSAGLAGWGLFGFLLFGFAIGCVALVSKSYLTLAMIVPLGGLSLGCLIICIMSASKK